MPTYIFSNYYIIENSSSDDKISTTNQPNYPSSDYTMPYKPSPKLYRLIRSIQQGHFNTYLSSTKQDNNHNDTELQTIDTIDV